MTDSPRSELEEMAALRRAVEIWIALGRPAPLGRWLEGALDPFSVPKRLPVPLWHDCLSLLDRACRERSVDWPEAFDVRIEGLFLGILRFSRPNGTAFFGPPGPPETGTLSLFRTWAGRLSDPGLSTVVDWWFPSRSRTATHAPPPLPAWSRSDRPLATLRASWSKEGDFLGLDHRERSASCALELCGLGRSWIGPTWTSGLGQGAATPARPTFWLSHPMADIAEWSFRAGDSRVLRSAVLFRGRRLALLADQVEGPDPTPSFRLGLPDGVTAGPIAESRGLTLTTRPRQPSAQIFPVGLPRLPYATERGTFGVEDRELTLRQKQEGRRCWLPLLVSWEPRRNRLPVHWRALTVTEKSRTCTPDTAFAARITWGRNETLLLYRSLARPGLRTVLGHQTSARFLVGVFNDLGEIEPILKVEE